MEYARPHWPIRMLGVRPRSNAQNQRAQKDSHYSKRDSEGQSDQRHYYKHVKSVSRNGRTRPTVSQAANAITQSTEEIRRQIKQVETARPRKAMPLGEGCHDSIVALMWRSYASPRTPFLNREQVLRHGGTTIHLFGNCVRQLLLNRRRSAQNLLIPLSKMQCAAEVGSCSNAEIHSRVEHTGIRLR